MDLSILTADGTFIVSYTPRGLASINFPNSGKRASSRATSIAKSIRAWHTLTEEALLASLSGHPVGELPPLDWTGATDFRKQVWTALLQISVGDIRTYQDIAQSIGKPFATRAVGNACGANPVPVLVPCHRVLAKGNKIGGFSAGLHWKRLLLGRERNL
jgi:O-6-methylguanine DNA methyltransferase